MESQLPGDEPLGPPEEKGWLVVPPSKKAPGTQRLAQREGSNQSSNRQVGPSDLPPKRSWFSRGSLKKLEVGPCRNNPTRNNLFAEGAGPWAKPPQAPVLTPAPMHPACRALTRFGSFHFCRRLLF